MWSILGILITISARNFALDLNIFEGNIYKDIVPIEKCSGLLYPYESESREVKSLDGLWDFAVPHRENLKQGDAEGWHRGLSKATKVMKIPVPSSYNDITTSEILRDHVGPVWYERTFYVPERWKSERIILRFGSVNYRSTVWLNDKQITTSEIGHLPFEVEITNDAICGGKNRLTVEVDNILNMYTTPQGVITNSDSTDGSKVKQSYTFDFFNYAGIHRPVLLYTTPQVFVEDVTVTTDAKISRAIDYTTGLETNETKAEGIIEYEIKIGGLRFQETPYIEVNVLDANHEQIYGGSLSGNKGTIRIVKANLWWPRSMSTNPGYLYTLQIKVHVVGGGKADVYRLPVGIRSLKWDCTSFLINDKPVYFFGFGKHEDSLIRGRGLDLVTMTRDFELLQWVGANAFRTSHYPYSEELLDLADRLGFLIIDECPSVDADNLSPISLKSHRKSLVELIRRDKNRPSVVMWSVANEPRSTINAADFYFEKVVEQVRYHDKTRPLTASLHTSSYDDKIGGFLDVISVNRYNGWYANPGRLETITTEVVEEMRNWHDKYKKLILMSEYGADTMQGLHELPAYIWSEEYQMELMAEHFKAFDELRAEGFFIGEFMWNFADFRTAQSHTRVGGNKKGIFTRDRQPKSGAFHVRRRYNALLEENDSFTNYSTKYDTFLPYVIRTEL